MPAEVPRQPREFFLYKQSRTDTAVPLAIAEPNPPEQPPGQSEGKPEGQDAADPAIRLEHCIGVQEKVISLLESRLRSLHQAGPPLPPASADSEMLVLLRDALRQERNILLDYRALQAEVESLHVRRDELAQALSQSVALSLTDELTGLPNRRAFVQRLDQELSRSQRSGQPLTVVLLDIDNFKNINDRHGHHVGDQILRSFAQGMLRELRQHDLLARYGGEEFVLLFPETLLEDARNATDKLARRLRRDPLTVGKNSVELPSFSAGVACLRTGDSTTTLINRADQCLYLAKRLGRNRIETDDQLPPSRAP